MTPNKIRLTIVLLFLSIQAVIAHDLFHGQTASSDIQIAPDKFIVKFKATADRESVNAAGMRSVFSKANIIETQPVFAHPGDNEIALKLNLNNVFVMHTAPNTDIPQLIASMQDDPTIEYIEPVYITKAQAEPDDSLYLAGNGALGNTYYLTQISAPQAWDVQKGSSDVVVGIVDSGVKYDHPDLESQIWVNAAEDLNHNGKLDSGDINNIDDDGNGYVDDVIGWDFVAAASDVSPGEDATVPDNDPMDRLGHGTHVAGISAAATDNQIGVAAASWGARIMPLRIGWKNTSGSGYGSTEYMAQAFMYAADNGADVVNLSYGNSGQVIIDAGLYAFLKGVLICVSAGNDNADAPSSLGTQRWSMNVASVASNDKKAYYSNFGDFVSISAPGGDFYNGSQRGILSTYIGTGDQAYQEFQGTSMASPVVASVAALVKSRYPEENTLELYNRLQQTADNIDAANPGYAGMLGSGRINAYRALTENVPAAAPFLTVNNYSIDDATGNSDGIINPGEQVTLKVKIRNEWGDATGVNATLLGEDIWPLTIPNRNSTVGSLSGIMDTTNWEATASFDIQCAANAIPRNLHLRLALNADGGYSDTTNISLAVSPSILFVGDWTNDAALSDFLSPYYFSGFEKNGFVYNYVNKGATHLDAAYLKQFPVVVWSCEWTFPSLDLQDRNALQDYLDNGGRLFLSGQDIGWDLNEGDQVATGGINFYENYLRSKYVADDAGYNTLSGVAGDPVGDGFSFKFFQPGRTSDQQYPDAVLPTNGSVSAFDYPNSNSGVIRYEGNYRLVYFSYGGYEAISDENIRLKMMPRVINWLNGVSMLDSVLTDTVAADGSYFISATITSTVDSLENVQLFWDTDNTLPFNEGTIEQNGTAHYLGTIPAQSPGTDIQYFILAKTSKGTYLPIRTMTFTADSGAVTANRQVDLNQVPDQFDLHQNYPNPFNPSTQIGYSLPEKGVVTLTIFDISGRKVRTLINQEQNSGDHQVTWNGKDNYGNPVAAGIYFYRLQANKVTLTRKMLLVK